jgi:catechol 2,3-dioxygenase-like lactoylglutathione lyase family enzyme
MATVRYLVDDVDAAARFYVEVLGFVEVERWGPAMAVLTRDDLHLWVAGPTASAARPMPDGRQPVPGGWNRIVVEVDDLDEVVARLRAAGTGFRNEPISGPGGRQVLVEDPAGNPIELFESR